MIALFRQEALDGASARLQGEVVLFQPLRTVVLAALIGATVLLVVLWMTLGSYARIQTVPGVVIEDADAAYVFAARPGVVTKLFARDDRPVKAGERLAVVRTESDTESGARPMAETLASLAVQQRQSETQLALAGRLESTDRDKLAAALSGARARRTQLVAQIGLQGEIIRSNQATFEQLEPVMQRGFVSRTEFERRRQLFLTAQQERNALRERLAETESTIAEAQAALARAPLDRIGSEASRRTEIETLRQEQLKARQANAYLITAPVAGRVSAVQTGPGRFVDGTKPLMTVMPATGRFAVEVFAPSRAVGFLRNGQEVRLLFDAFPYEKYGSFGGRVESIARNVIRPDQLDAPVKVDESVYRVRVLLDDDKLARSAGKMRLQAGMTLAANVILDRRSFVEWLLEPLAAVSERS